ncbi:MAG: hypothetical protein M1816_007416 [Peltula sp. TS41687]|nr:MAG: hypothetical protein M1816_007416 [Peltula sp. TS41687]
MSTARPPAAAAAPPPGHFRILYFATASSYTKKQSDLFTAPLPLSHLFDVLEGRYPGIRRRVLSSCAVTLNLEYTDVEMRDDAHGGHDDDDGHRPERAAATVAAQDTKDVVLIQEGDEVAIIPPVSSG